MNKAVFHQGLHCLLRLKQSLWKEVHYFNKILTSNPLKYKTDNSILIVSICMGKSIKILHISRILTNTWEGHLLAYLMGLFQTRLYQCLNIPQLSRSDIVFGLVSASVRPFRLSSPFVCPEPYLSTYLSDLIHSWYK